MWYVACSAGPLVPPCTPFVTLVRLPGREEGGGEGCRGKVMLYPSYRNFRCLSWVIDIRWSNKFVQYVEYVMCVTFFFFTRIELSCAAQEYLSSNTLSIYYSKILYESDARNFDIAHF